MKNIHLIPTDKPSKLYLNGFQRLVLDDKIEIVYDDYSKNQNIYITSNEDYAINDTVVAKDGSGIAKIIEFENGYVKAIDLSDQTELGIAYHQLNDWKKIILTTDQSLDGVQAIDDEFLEWFVKNPSCEWVKVRKNPKVHFIVKGKGVKGFNQGYKIIIPKEEPKQIKCYCGHTTYCDCSPLEEPKDVVLGSKTSLDAQMLDRFEPKQETLEEAAKRIYGTDESKDVEYYAFILGAKWQAERMYSEEEVKHIVSEALQSALVGYDLEQWFTQFRKK